MKVPHPNPKRKGEYLTYPFVNNYTVAAPSAVISSDQLNIMYMGLNNEISISAPGMKPEDLIVTASNGCRVTSKGNGKYVFVPKRGGKINITVTAKINGENKVISQQTWKSSSLPEPKLIIPGIKGSRASAKTLAQILSSMGARPEYDKSFPISAKPQIRTAGVGFVSDGNIISPKALIKGKTNSSSTRTIGRLKRGNTVTITMKAVGPDGIPHNLTRTITIK
jgi:hypothetical protein